MAQSHFHVITNATFPEHLVPTMSVADRSVLRRISFL